MIEHEKKILLTEDEYMCVLNGGYDFSDKEIHINHYYDTDELKYNDLGITCRIRENDTGYVATVKNHYGLETSNETSTYVKNEMDISPFEGMDVKYFGSMKTERRKATPIEGVTLVLDCNLYLDKVDYELEIEYTVENDKMAVCLLESVSDDIFYNGLTRHRKEILLYANTSPNKSQRFFRRFSELKFDRTPVSCKQQVHEFGGFAHAQIDVQSGNLKVELEGIDFYDMPPLLTAGFIYDSAAKKDVASHKTGHLKGLSGFYKMKLGYGWSFSLVQSMIPKEIPYGGVVYDGYIFTNEKGEKSYFIPTSGSHLKNEDFEIYTDTDDKNCTYDAAARKLYSNGNVYWFDVNGRLYRILDNDKNCVEITYIGNRIMGASDNNGNEIFLDYNLCGQIKTITTSDGRSAVCSYNSTSGMLNSIAYSNGNSVYLKYTDNKISCIELVDSKKSGVYKVEYSYKDDRIRKVEEFFFDENGEYQRCCISKYNYCESNKKTIVYNTEIAYVSVKKSSITKSKSVYSFNKDGKVLTCYVYPYEYKKRKKYSV